MSNAHAHTTIRRRIPQMVATRVLRRYGEDSADKDAVLPQTLERPERASGAEDHGLERRVGDMHWDVGLGGDARVEPAQQSTATGQHHPALEDVVGELRRGFS